MKFKKTTPEEYVDMGYTEEDEITTEKLEMHFIELPKFRKKKPDVADSLEQWLWLISGEEEKIKMAETKNKEIKKAVSIIEEMSMSEQEWELYESRRIATLFYNTEMRNAENKARKERKN